MKTFGSIGALCLLSLRLQAAETLPVEKAEVFIYGGTPAGVMAAFREESRKWGLPLDEFADSGHFPFQLYIREARRMIGA